MRYNVRFLRRQVCGVHPPSSTDHSPPPHLYPRRCLALTTLLKKTPVVDEKYEIAKKISLLVFNFVNFWWRTVNQQLFKQNKLMLWILSFQRIRNQTLYHDAICISENFKQNKNEPFKNN